MPKIEASVEREKKVDIFWVAMESGLLLFRFVGFSEIQ